MEEKEEQHVGERKLGFGALVAIVFGMMVGSGLYNIPQNLAAGAGPGAVVMAWIITAIGMLLLVGTLKILSSHRPDLDAGIYQYSQQGFGNFAGFNIAWGYWLCTAFANVAYAVMLNDSFGAFWKPLLHHGWETLAFGTILIWSMYFIVSGGIKTAKLLNNMLAIIKISAILLICVLLYLNFKVGTFRMNLFEESLSGESLISQVKSTMLVTLWCFIGIEGATMMAARAKRPTDVGKAGVVGFLTAWLLYVLVSLLCFGVMNRAQLAGLGDPSVAYVLRAICGDWAYYLVIISVIISLLGGWLAWTLVCAQVPYEAAVVKIFPKSFLRLNRHGMPGYGLLVSSVVMESFLIVVLTTSDVYMSALEITGMMVLPAYLFAGMYLWKVSMSGKQLPGIAGWKLWRARIIGILCTFYCLWLIYAGGFDLFAYTSFFYVAGFGFYFKSLNERNKAGERRVSRSDMATALLLLFALGYSAYLLINS